MLFSDFIYISQPIVNYLFTFELYILIIKNINIYSQYWYAHFQWQPESGLKKLSHVSSLNLGNRNSTINSTDIWFQFRHHFKFLEVSRYFIYRNQTQLGFCFFFLLVPLLITSGSNYALELVVSRPQAYQCIDLVFGWRDQGPES